MHARIAFLLLLLLSVMTSLLAVPMENKESHLSKNSPTRVSTDARTEAGANQTSAIARTSEALQRSRSSTLDVSEEPSELDATEQESTGTAQQLSTEVKAVKSVVVETGKKTMEQSLDSNPMLMKKQTLAIAHLEKAIKNLHNFIH